MESNDSQVPRPSSNLEASKKVRTGKRVLENLTRRDFSNDLHVIIGGTGAVGGTTALWLIRFYDSALRQLDHAPAEMPTILITGKTRQEIRSFTRRLFDWCQLEYGADAKPEKIAGIGYRLPNGIRIEFVTLSVSPNLSGITGLQGLGHAQQQTMMEVWRSERQVEGEVSFLHALGEAVEQEVTAPFTAFLRDYLKGTRTAKGSSITSVIIGIPLPSVAAYQLNDLELACRLSGVTDPQKIDDLKARFLERICDDLEFVAKNLSEEVLVAHTTAVGGMYDVEENGERVIRLGFAHAAVDAHLAKKQVFAEGLSRLYANRAIKVLVTAAAIGIDEVQIRQPLAMKGDIHKRLNRAADEETGFIPPTSLAHKKVEAMAPVTLDPFAAKPDSIRFEGGPLVKPSFSLRSGENGFFSVSNADTLYRVMRVASASELAIVLSSVALAGDDPLAPWFANQVCYYTETDNSRQVFDFLAIPDLARTQTAGLEPKAFQDLGSSKHQGELHLLGLLILLHRLKTLDIEKIPMDVDLGSFNPAHFFEAFSECPTLDDICRLDPDELRRHLNCLVMATSPSDLAPLCHLAYKNLPGRNQAYWRVMMEVLRAVSTICALGSPILYRHQGRTLVRCGPFVAPLDLVVTREDDVAKWFREHVKSVPIENPTPRDVELYAEFCFASEGFVDIRPTATLVRTRQPMKDLEQCVAVYDNESDLREALDELAPYSFFTTSGLLALMTRLRGLQTSLGRFDLRLGSLNEHRTHVPRDAHGRCIFHPGVIEAFRMVSEGLEKNTGTELLDGSWGY